MPKPYSGDLRERVLLADEAGLLPAAIAERFGVGLSTVYLWRQQARREGRRCAKPPGGGQVRGVDAAGEAMLRALVAERNDRTLDEYVEQLAERSGGPKVSRPTLCRALRRLGLGRKKKTLRASEQDRADIQAERAVFCERVQQLDAKDLVFIDETGITTAMTRLYARGARARGSAPGGWRRLTVLGALSDKGMVAAMSIAAATTTQVSWPFYAAC